ncbi:MAG: MFS transporter [Clostridia bacterium]|nr:MFS transporter [Clostridia bacterium]
MMKRYEHTIVACYIGYITQAIVNNFAPLLFLTFQSSFDLRLEQITLLVTFNFLTQLVVDLLAAKFVDRIGYRPCVVAAHGFCALGLVGLGLFPTVLPPYAGLLLAVMIYAIGGGLIEVLISPIVDACPSENKSAAMSLLHSFYCWGTVAVVLLSTLLFALLGMESWKLVGCLWALVPAVNALLFLRVPIAPIVAEGEGLSISELFRQKIFWILALLMVCAGASEQAMSQWASAFAESGLRVSKTMGDLAGPCFFSILMGTARVVHSKLAERVNLEKYIVLCALLCIGSYVLAILPLHPVLNLLGCGLCGFSVGVFWPGTFSTATARCPLGGTAMFALLALAGDLGCSLGPTVVGFVSAAFGDVLKVGLAAAIGFPLLILVGIRLLPSEKTE